jgi:putative ABC transport system substrate-binding protein
VLLEFAIFAGASKKLFLSRWEKKVRGREGKHMKNKIVCFTLCAMLFALCASTGAQQQSRIPKIGFLGARSAESGTGLERLRQELRALGYIERKTIVFESRYADNKLNRLPALADELVRIKVDVLVAAQTPEATAAKNATKTIPIIFVTGGDPVAAGLTESLARPGGNITGFTILQSMLAGKRIELLKEIIPRLSRVAVLWDSQDPGSTQQWKESQVAAKELGLQVHSLEVNSRKDLENAFKEAIKGGSAAVAVTQSPSLGDKSIADLATKYRLPVIRSSGNFVNTGGLMFYGPDRTEPYRRAASMVDKILKGAKPADLPVERSTKFEFIINLKAAKQIGLTIPPNVLVRADRVIK